MDDKNRKPSGNSAKEYQDEWALKNWRAWGSWFSWGSPTGLGLFFISLALSAWILAQAGLIGSR